MKLNELGRIPGTGQARKRIGRGIGSGTGKTGGRGVKGQKSRSGVSIRGFEGGQMPLYRRLPKRGFNNSVFTKNPEIVNLDRLQDAIDRGTIDASQPITEQTLHDGGMVKLGKDGVRLLGRGELKQPLTITVTAASANALALVSAAGGTVTTTAPSKDKSAEADTGKGE